MSRSESESRIVAVCRACKSVFVSEQKPDGTIRPIGVSQECTCGDGDFERITPSGGSEPTNNGGPAVPRPSD